MMYANGLFSFVYKRFSKWDGIAIHQRFHIHSVTPYITYSVGGHGAQYGVSLAKFRDEFEGILKEEHFDVIEQMQTASDDSELMEGLILHFKLIGISYNIVESVL